MKKKLSVAIGVLLGTFQFNDVAFTYRMSAGFPGRVNRTHPWEIDAILTDSANNTPMTAYGQGAILDGPNNAVRPAASSDQSATPITIYGITVSPFPSQQAATVSGSIGQYGGTQGPTGATAIIAPPTVGPIDVIRMGYIMCQLATAGQSPNKGGQVYIWCTATTGTPGTTGYHVQGGFETVASAGNTVPVKNAQFNGPADTSGNVEIYVIPSTLL